MNVWPRVATAAIRPATPLPGALIVRAGKRHFTRNGRFEDGDAVVLKRPDKADVGQELIHSLRRGWISPTRWGDFKHDSLIGHQVRHEVVLKGHRRVAVRAFQPTLAEYVTLSPRKVTPIYPHDANLIVSLLDIHVGQLRHKTDSPEFEILEAGTGHGALTLYLSRALHGANGLIRLKELGLKSSRDRPKREETKTGTESEANPELKIRKVKSTSLESEPTPLKSKDDSVSVSQIQSADPMVEGASPTWDAGFEGKARKLEWEYTPPADETAYVKEWKRNRRAVIHTVDTSASHSEHAARILQNFRHGEYAANVDFHVGDVADFINNQYKERGQKEQIFNHIILDLPGVHSYMEDAARALKDDGTLIVFAPSVTQLARCVQMLRRKRLPLAYEDCIELGMGLSSGRIWDVRAVRPGISKPSEETPEHVAEAYYSDMPAGEQPVPKSIFQRTRAFFRRLFGIQQKSQEEREQEDWVMVCRPRVGVRIMGGGFLGIWKRKSKWLPWEDGGDGEAGR